MADRLRDDYEGRIRDLERKVSNLYAIVQRGEPDFDSDGSLSEGVIELVQQNRIIEAVKLHREETGLGLAEAKAAIDEHGRFG